MDMGNAMRLSTIAPVSSLIVLAGLAVRAQAPLAGDRDGRPEVLAVHPQGNPACTGLSVLKSEEGFQSPALHLPTALHPTDGTFAFGLGDYDRDGVADLYAIKKSRTGSRSTEVHVLGGAGGFRSWLQNAGTILHETGAEGEFCVADWNRDGAPDVWYIRKVAPWSGRTEVLILDGASWYTTYSVQIATVLHPTGAEADFCVGDWNRDGIPDLWYVRKIAPWSGRTEVLILNGADRFQSYLLMTATGLGEVAPDRADFDTGDADGDGIPDLYVMLRHHTGSGRTEVHALSGATRFSQFNLHSSTSLHETGAADRFLVAPPVRRPVKVMTFNVRFADLGGASSHQWDWRKFMVFDVIRNHAADVVGLQEALPHQVDQILADVPAYAGVGAVPGRGWVGTSILLYRKDRYRVDESGTFWLAGPPDSIPDRWTGTNRTCVWARLVDLASGRAFYAYNTHLRHGPEGPRYDGARRILDRIARRTRPDPVVLLGDMNATEGSNTTRMLRGRLLDTFRAVNPSEKHANTAHGFLGGTLGTPIDYIFAEFGTRVTASRIDRHHVGGRYPSDHFPMTSTLEFAR
jgi:endonuclease/exonuclease/phosphatase family metal-dependent hydrolase